MNHHACPARLCLGGRDFSCDWPTDTHGQHPGWAHSNSVVKALWFGDPEELNATGRQPCRPGCPICAEVAAVDLMRDDGAGGQEYNPDAFDPADRDAIESVNRIFRRG